MNFFLFVSDSIMDSSLLDTNLDDREAMFNQMLLAAVSSLLMELTYAVHVHTFIKLKGTTGYLKLL